MEFITFADFADTLFMLFGDDYYKRYMWAYFLIGGIGFAIIYIFKSVALYTIARREGFANSWMAFVPILNTYYAGVLADKNRIFGLKAKTVSLIAAIAEFAYVAMNIIYYAAQGVIFAGGYAVPQFEATLIGNTYVDVFSGYGIVGLPVSLSWAGWVYAYFPEAFLYWLNLLSVVSYILVMIAFFQTYSCRHYVLFSIFSALFPLSGIFMFVVRNNRGKNYTQFVKERQYRQYQQYQEYMRNNGGYNNPNGGYNNPNDPYNGGRGAGSEPPKDPFDGMGGQSGNGGSQSGSDGRQGGSSGGSGDDPFGDFE